MGIFDLLFPVTCLECDVPGKYLCNKCLSKVKRAKQICIKCGKASIDGFVHAKCRRAWGFDGVFSIWNYEGVVRRAILKLKYNFAYDIAHDLANNMVKYINKEFTPLPKNTLLIPVPLHKARTKWRGFNQSQEVGKIVVEKLNWSFNSEILTRRKKTKPQVELKGDERKQNVKGIFKLGEDKKTLVLNSQSLVLFDDVLTTGATLKEACKVLKRAGAKSVWGLTIAS